MPVSLDFEPSTSHPSGVADRSRRDSAAAGREPDASWITIGLVNNMPDSALSATERQFVALLAAAAGTTRVRLRSYALPGVPRSERGREYVRRSCSPVEELWGTPLDAVIVTGTEPRSRDLRDEPYWPSLTQLFAWAEKNTRSAIWSCLAAHAAVLHLDGIERRPLEDKRFGVFECAVAADALTAGLPRRIRMPHSRWNELPEERLVAAGYRALTRSPGAGVDAFVRKGPSLFLFFQGHPEYEAETLMLEYRRDVKRFLNGERATYPAMPREYFDDRTSEMLSIVRDRALGGRREEAFHELEMALGRAAPTNRWQPAAVRLYRNWLGHLAAQKAGGAANADALVQRCA